VEEEGGATLGQEGARAAGRAAAALVRGGTLRAEGAPLGIGNRNPLHSGARVRDLIRETPGVSLPGIGRRHASRRPGQRGPEE
jgi:hypothetical protein